MQHLEVNCGLNLWFAWLTGALSLKLLLLGIRYKCFKHARQESIVAFLGDTIISNLALTAVFIRGNQLYFDDASSMCGNDSMSLFGYRLFTFLLVLGYAQFVWCIMLSCYLPLSGILIYKLVQHRMNQGEGFLGGLIQLPLPISEILNSLNRTKYRGLQTLEELEVECKICMLDFQGEDVVTPLLCDERHLYHTKCIEAWIKTGHNTCPYCRKEIANV